MALYAVLKVLVNVKDNEYLGHLLGLHEVGALGNFVGHQINVGCVRHRNDWSLERLLLGSVSKCPCKDRL